jgi:hypothetical protein
MGMLNKTSLFVVAATVTIWALVQSSSGQNSLDTRTGPTTGAPNATAEINREEAVSRPPIDSEARPFPNIPFPIIKGVVNPYTHPEAAIEPPVRPDLRRP